MQLTVRPTPTAKFREFFRTRPCSSLRRAQFEVRSRNGDVALVSIAWVEMPTEAEARQLRTLMDTGGTGNVTELSCERGRYRTVRYTGMPTPPGERGQWS